MQKKLKTRTGFFRRLWTQGSRVVSQWMEDEAFRLSAALAYYTIFSIGPLLLLSIGLAGLYYGAEAVQGAVTGQLTALLGYPTASAINSFLADTSNQTKNRLTTLVGIIVLIFGASAVFLELKASLNTIWKVSPKAKSGFLSLVMVRLLSVAMVISTGFLLLVSLVISAALAAVSNYIEAASGVPPFVFRLLETIASVAVIACVFTLIFRLLPDAEVEWKNAFKGALLSACLFTAGKWGIGIYLGQSAFSSTYGASASVTVILLWTYYSALILFLGVEVTKICQNFGEDSVFQKSIRS